MGIIVSRTQRDNEQIDQFIKSFCGNDTFVTNLLREFRTFCDLCFIDRKLLVEYGLDENRVDEFIEKFATYAYPDIWKFLQQVLDNSSVQYDRIEMFLKFVSKFYNKNKAIVDKISSVELAELGVSEADHQIVLDRINKLRSPVDIPKPTVYVSVDVETTGTSPATSSCVMIGAVVFSDCDDLDVDTPEDKWIIDKRCWCIKEVAGRPMTKICYESFWTKQQKLWDYIQSNASTPDNAMRLFADWYDKLSTQYNCIFVARPSSFDWQWVNCIYDEFGPQSKKCLPHSIRCISTIGKIFELLKLDQTYENLIKHPSYGVNHHAQDDALYQGWMYLRLTNWIKSNLTTR